MHDVVSLFAGCGGMDLGFRGGFAFLEHDYARLPFRVVFANEHDKRPADVYSFNMPEAPMHVADVADVMERLPRRADVLTGGFPCQDVSINGGRSASKGSRTMLYRYMLAAAERMRPHVIIAENVRGLLSSDL